MSLISQWQTRSIQHTIQSRIIDCGKFDKSRPAIHPFSSLSLSFTFALFNVLLAEVPKRIYKSVFWMKSDVSETLHFMIYWKYREYFAIKFSPLFLSTRLLPPTHSRIHPSPGTTTIHFLFSYISYLATDLKVYRRRRQAIDRCIYV